MSSDEFSQNLSYPAPYLKQFVQSKNSCLTNVACTADKTESPAKHRPNNFNTDAKITYENIVGTKAFLKHNKTNAVKIKSTGKPKKRDSCISGPNVSQAFNLNQLMKASETNNLPLVQELCKQNKHLFINRVDEFGWTPLMSACCAGAVEVVKLLLHWKADVTIRNKKGKTCWDLAKSKGHFSVLRLLTEYKQNDGNKSVNIDQTSHSVEIPSTSRTKFYCECCKQNIEDLGRSKHESSMMHLFNSAQKSKMPTIYGIPESNKGFQILLKGGWDKERGLGPEGTGHKFPPKTILKQDKTGLGAKEYKARVTHLLNVDDQKSKIKHTVRSNIKKEKRSEKRLERKLRQMLS